MIARIVEVVLGFYGLNAEYDEDVLMNVAINARLQNDVCFQENMMDRVAVNFRVALGMFFEAGFQNEELLWIAINAIHALIPAAEGYYYADDVVVAIRGA